MFTDIMIPSTLELDKAWFSYKEGNLVDVLFLPKIILTSPLFSSIMASAELFSILGGTSFSNFHDYGSTTISLNLIVLGISILTLVVSIWNNVVFPFLDINLD